MSQLLLGCQLLLVKQLELSEQSLSEEAKHTEEQGASTVLQKGLRSKTRSRPAMICFPLPSIPLQSAEEVVFSCRCYNGARPSWVRHAALCTASSGLQCSAVQPDPQNLCSHVPWYSWKTRLGMLL